MCNVSSNEHIIYQSSVLKSSLQVSHRVNALASHLAQTSLVHVPSIKRTFIQEPGLIHTLANYCTLSYVTPQCIEMLYITFHLRSRYVLKQFWWSMLMMSLHKRTRFDLCVLSQVTLIWVKDSRAIKVTILKHLNLNLHHNHLWDLIYGFQVLVIIISLLVFSLILSLNTNQNEQKTINVYFGHWMCATEFCTFSILSTTAK